MLLLMTVASQVSCKWVYKMLGPGFTQTCLYFYWHWVQKLIVKPLDTSWAKKLDMPDGKVLILCKTCTKVNAVLVPIPPCLIVRTASQTCPTKNHNNKHIIWSNFTVESLWGFESKFLYRLNSISVQQPLDLYRSER